MNDTFDLPAFTKSVSGLKPAFLKAKSELAELEKSIEEQEASQETIASEIARMRRARANENHVRQRDTVSDEFAGYLAAVTILGAMDLGRQLNLSPSKREALRTACQWLMAPVVQRSALTTGDIPLPVAYNGELISLVQTYGKARKFGTVYRLGRGKNRLPHLASSPAFGFLDQSAAITEKSPQIDFVNLDAEKAGGIVRLPSEIDQDSLVSLGQFLATYAAREMAKWEDTVFFMGDGSGTYKGFKGCAKAALDNGRKVTLGAGVASPSEIVLANLRALRAAVSSAALIKGAYYFNPTMEVLLCSLNNANEQPFTQGPDGPRLDNYPVRWVEALPVYDTADHAAQLQGVFGDLSYQYLGVIPGALLEVSRSVFFTTDELAVRALERFSTALTDSGAVAVLQLGSAS